MRVGRRIKPETKIWDNKLYKRVYGAETRGSRAQYDLVLGSPTCGNSYWKRIGEPMRTEREIVLEELAKAGANIEQARDLLTSVDLDIWRACSELSKGVGHLELAVDRLMTVSKEALNKVLDREA